MANGKLPFCWALILVGMLEFKAIIKGGDWWDTQEHVSSWGSVELILVRGSQFSDSAIRKLSKITISVFSTHRLMFLYFKWLSYLVLPSQYPKKTVVKSAQQSVGKLDKSQHSLNSIIDASNSLSNKITLSTSKIHLSPGYFVGFLKSILNSVEALAMRENQTSDVCQLM